MPSFDDQDGVTVAYRRWLPAAPPAGVLVVAHGASEHSGRYDRFAGFLASRGFAVYALDHRGHGLTAEVTGAGVAGPRGWEGMVDDLSELADIAEREASEAAGRPVPMVLFGHSMGSFLAQLHAQRHGGRWAGLVLSGSAGGIADLQGSIDALEAFAAAGAGGEPAAIFGPFNARFEPARTPFDWLSRDEAEVDAYIADPLCGEGNPLTVDFVADMLRHAAEAWDPQNERRIPADLPVLLVTGEEDPVSDGGRTVRDLEARYRANGVRSVTALYYRGARHELLNETNRDEVHADIARWLEQVAAGRRTP